MCDISRVAVWNYNPLLFRDFRTVVEWIALSGIAFATDKITGISTIFQDEVYLVAIPDPGVLFIRSVISEFHRCRDGGVHFS